MIREYIRHSRRTHKLSVQEFTPQSPSYSELWNEAVDKNGLILTIILLPFWLLYFLIGILLLPLWIVLIPALLIGGFFIYMIPSVIIGGFIDLLRQVFVKKDYWFENWKYTDKALDFWGIIPYRMSVAGYRSFKAKSIRQTKQDEIFEKYCEGEIDREQANTALQNIHPLKDAYDKIAQARMREDVEAVLKEADLRIYDDLVFDPITGRYAKVIRDKPLQENEGDL